MVTVSLVDVLIQLCHPPHHPTELFCKLVLSRSSSALTTEILYSKTVVKLQSLKTLKCDLRFGGLGVRMCSVVEAGPLHVIKPKSRDVH